MKIYVSLAHVKILKALFDLLSPKQSRVTREQIIEKSGISKSQFSKLTQSSYLLDQTQLNTKEN
jgi:hypothetical protein